MRVVVRADASVRIGAGHVSRCMALAARMRSRGADVTFVCRQEAGNLLDTIAAQDFATVRLPATDESGQAKGAGESTWEEEDAALTRRYLASEGGSADVLIVDQYELGERWERETRRYAGRVVVIDDLANRRHDCDVLIDPNLHDSPESRYAALVAPSTRVFVGPRYAPLREEFAAISPQVRTGGLSRMLIFFGGAGPASEALKVIGALRRLAAGTPEAMLIAGPINPDIEKIEADANTIRSLSVLKSSKEMARLVAWADVGIGTCGVAAWERCALGLPSLVVITADNQRDDARMLHEIGAVRNLGDARETTAERWAAAIGELQSRPAEVRKMSIASAGVMEGWREARLEVEKACLG